MTGCGVFVDTEQWASHNRRLARATDAEARLLGSLRTLRCLELPGTRVTDVAMPQIAGLTALTRLDLRDCAKLSAAGVSHVRALTSLQNLALSIVMLRGECAAFAQLQALTCLLLVSCGLRDADVEQALPAARQLRVLRLDNSDVEFISGAVSKEYSNQFSAALWGVLRQGCPGVRVLGAVIGLEEDGNALDAHVAGLMRCSNIQEVTVRFSPLGSWIGSARQVGLLGQSLLTKYGQAYEASDCMTAPVCFWFPAESTRL